MNTGRFPAHRYSRGCIALFSYPQLLLSGHECSPPPTTGPGAQATVRHDDPRFTNEYRRHLGRRTADYDRISVGPPGLLVLLGLLSAEAGP